MLPERLKIDTSIYSKDWRVVTTGERALAQTIEAAGWNFFFTVGKLEGMAFGALSPNTVRRALRSILRQVEEQHFNAVQITGIAERKAMGLIRYITISAHARHLQRSEQLDTDQVRKTQQTQSAWAVG